MAETIAARILELQADAETAEDVQRRFPDAMVGADGYESVSVALEMCDVVQTHVVNERVFLRAGARVGRAVVWRQRIYACSLSDVLTALLRDDAGKAALLAALGRSGG
jgi:hypothetical protein